MWSRGSQNQPQHVGLVKASFKRLHLGGSCRDGEIWGFNFPTKHFCPSCANVLQLNTFQNDPPKKKEKLQPHIPLMMSAFVPPRATTVSQAISSLETEIVMFPPLMQRRHSEQTDKMSVLSRGR